MVVAMKTSATKTKTSATADENVWFDGVDKKLIEAHSAKALVEGNDHTLLTKTPLASFASYKQRKKEATTSGNSNKKANGSGLSRKKDGTVVQKASLSRDTMRPNTGITDELALDCEMVECYHHRSVLARVSIVNLFGHPILDKYVAPPAKVTDYRTKYSGIRKSDLDGAPEFDSVRQEVAELIKGRIVVGHALHNDFHVLKIEHPQDKIRDTSHYYKYLFQGKTPSLKKLSESVLGLAIQKGEHDSVQDAQATMRLYVKERDRWNQSILKGNQSRAHNRQTKKPLKKKTKTFYVLTT